MSFSMIFHAVLGPVRRGAGRTGLLTASAWLVSVSAHQMLPVCARQAEERQGMRP